MRAVFIALFCLASVGSFAQDDADRITLSTFTKPTDVALLDTIKKSIATNQYKNYLVQEQEVYNKATKLNKFTVIGNLLKQISKQGTEDVSKCFLPRHSINFYKGDKLVKYVLVCFECYGLRFSDERWITNVKSEKKRIALMDELKARFASEGY